MSGRAQAQQLVDQLASILGFSALIFDEDNTLVLQFQNELVVLIGIDATETSLTFLTSLAASAGPKSADFLESLLQANFLWTDTDGATIGIDGQNGPVTLQKRQRISELTYPVFEAELSGFVDIAFAWSRKAELGTVMDKIQDGVDADDEPDDEPSLDDTSSWMRA